MRQELRRCTNLKELRAHLISTGTQRVARPA